MVGYMAETHGGREGLQGNFWPKAVPLLAQDGSGQAQDGLGRAKDGSGGFRTG